MAAEASRANDLKSGKKPLKLHQGRKAGRCRAVGGRSDKEKVVPSLSNDQHSRNKMRGGGKKAKMD